MTYLIKLPPSFLTLRFVQVGLTLIVLIIDIVSIVELSQNGVISYGPTAWGIWTVSSKSLRGCS